MRGPITRLAVAVALVAALLTPAVGAVGVSPAAAGGGCSGDRVISVGVGLMARPGRHTHTVQLATPIPAGAWQVIVRSSDEGQWRAGQDQPREQWRLSFAGGPTLGPTTDLPDGVDRAVVTDQLGTVRLDAPVTALTLRHVREPVRGGTDSVVADCVALRRVGSIDPPPPPTTVGPPPTSPPPTVPPPTVPPPTVPPPVTAPPPPRPRPAPPTPAPPAPPAIAVAAAVDCARGTLEVAIGNQGGRSVTVDLAVPRGGVVNDLVVAPGPHTTERLALDPAFEDGAVEIRVTDAATGAALATTSLSVDCLPEPRPTAATRLDCAAGELLVTVGNEQGPPVELTVIHERVEARDPVAVAAGERVDVALAVDGPELDLRVVDGSGADVLRSTIDTDCPGPDPLDVGDAEPEPEPGEGALDAGAPDGDEADAATAPAVDRPAVALHTTVEVGCDARRARLTMRRGSAGHERVVVLLDDDPVAVVDLHGDSPVTVDVDVTGTGELAVVRPELDDDEPAVHGVSCRGDDGIATQVASGLVMVAVLASAVAVLPRRHRSVTLDS